MDKMQVVLKYMTTCVLEGSTGPRGVIRRDLNQGDEETVCIGTTEIPEPSASLQREAL